MNKALRSGGTFLMQDIAASTNAHRNIAPLPYTSSCMHCMTVSLAQGGEDLGAMWGEGEALEVLADAGFTDTDVRQLPQDFQNSYFISRKQ